MVEAAAAARFFPPGWLCISGLRARLCVCAEKFGRVELIVRCPEECVDDGIS